MVRELLPRVPLISNDPCHQQHAVHRFQLLVTDPEFLLPKKWICEKTNECFIFIIFEFLQWNISKKNMAYQVDSSIKRKVSFGTFRWV